MLSSPFPVRMFVPAPVGARDTRAWRLRCGSRLVGGGAVRHRAGELPGEDLDRAFMVMGDLFCLTSAFGLPKFIRDNEQRRADTPGVEVGCLGRLRAGDGPDGVGPVAHGGAAVWIRPTSR